MRTSSRVVADITTLNFNVLFEIGYAIGLDKPLHLIRDTTIQTDKKSLDELGVISTIGYAPYTNSGDIIKSYQSAKLFSDNFSFDDLFREQPIYVVKGKFETEGAVRLFSVLKKSKIRFRTFDPVETPRISLFEVKNKFLGRSE